MPPAVLVSVAWRVVCLSPQIRPCGNHERMPVLLSSEEEFDTWPRAEP